MSVGFGKDLISKYFQSCQGQWLARFARSPGVRGRSRREFTVALGSTRRNAHVLFRRGRPCPLLPRAKAPGRKGLYDYTCIFPLRAAVPTLRGCKGTQEKGLYDYTCFRLRGDSAGVPAESRGPAGVGRARPQRDDWRVAGVQGARAPSVTIGAWREFRARAPPA